MKIIQNHTSILSEKMTYLESHGASSSRNFSFLRWNTLLTAEHMNRIQGDILTIKWKLQSPQ